VLASKLVVCKRHFGSLAWSINFEQYPREIEGYACLEMRTLHVFGRSKASKYKQGSDLGFSLTVLFKENSYNLGFGFWKVE